MLDAVSKAIKFAHEQEMSTLRCTFPSLPCKNIYFGLASL